MNYFPSWDLYTFGCATTPVREDACVTLDGNDYTAWPSAGCGMQSAPHTCTHTRLPACTHAQSRARTHGHMRTRTYVHATYT